MDGPVTRSWRDFFDQHAPYYLQNSFTKNTVVEVQFLVEVMQLREGTRLLDMGCGVGRHSIELARRGIKVTGVDFSSGMLFEAKRNAESAQQSVEFIEADATQWVAAEPFDAAICLCEGGLGLIGHDEDAVQHDLAILRNIGLSLVPGAPFVMTALNGYATIRAMKDEDVEAGAFDPSNMVSRYANTMELPEGPSTVHIKERLFIPPEMTAMLHHAGFETLHVWGGTAGDWGKRSLKLDEIEAMYVCQKR